MFKDFRDWDLGNFGSHFSACHTDLTKKRGNLFWGFMPFSGKLRISRRGWNYKPERQLQSLPIRFLCSSWKPASFFFHTEPLFLFIQSACQKMTLQRLILWHESSHRHRMSWLFLRPYFWKNSKGLTLRLISHTKWCIRCHLTND